MINTIEATNPRNAILGNVIAKTQETKAALREQTDNFEALLLKTLLDEAMPKADTLFGEGAGSEIYRSLYHEALSGALAGGFGYSELLYNSLADAIKEK
ncbi:MAG: rod-binding protein [Helicobacteraceae bacterium]|jgi:Rod binding domain-containing protein|nr:rod-binding protein [Helicobacteraceae bacterium]